MMKKNLKRDQNSDKVIKYIQHTESDIPIKPNLMDMSSQRKTL